MLMTTFSLLSIYWISGCTKAPVDASAVTASKSEELQNLQRTILQPKTNPYSIRNVQKAMAALQAANTTSATTSLVSLPQYVYYKFDPQQLTSSQFDSFKDDSTVFMLDIPFGNASIYTEDFALDSNKIEGLKDGNLYGVTAITNTTVINALSSTIQAQMQVLDTLVKIPAQDTALLFQCLNQAGFSETQINRWRICLFNIPHGFVRYQDNDLLGSYQPVRGMAVWALGFGIPSIGITDGNGQYVVPSIFNFAVIMGTYARNDKVFIRPVNTKCNYCPFGIPDVNLLIRQFILGPMHIDGIKAPCHVRDGVDFYFGGHTQVKYWSQILNGYYLHHVYSVVDNIHAAPNNLMCYAVWNNGNTIGEAGMPLLNKIGFNQILINGTLQKHFNLNGAPLSTYFALLFSRQLPDNIYAIGGDAEPVHYCSRLAQTAYHELGHASQYQRVGNNWHARLAVAELGPTYGNPGDADWGKIQVGESWADFIGTQHAQRTYGAVWGFKDFTELGITNYSAFNIDRERFFIEGWIPTGFYNDLIDVANANGGEFADDLVGGSSISNMYFVFDSKTDDMCVYSNQFRSAYPAFNQPNFFVLTDFYNRLASPFNFPCR